MPTNSNDQTQVPSEGQERQDQSSSDLTKRLETLQAQLAATQREAQKNQARADKAEQRLTEAAAARRTLPTQQNAARVPPGTPPAAPEPDLAEIVRDQQRELMLLRSVSKHGLTLTDVEGIEFETQAQLETQLEVLNQRREIEKLKQQLSTQREPLASEVQIDTGGPSGGAAKNSPSQRVAEFRAKAEEMRKRGKRDEAMWLTLRAAYSDPEKHSLVRPHEDE